MRDNTDSTNSRTSGTVVSPRDTGSFVHISTQTPSSLSARSRICAMIPKRYARFALVTCLLVAMTVVYVTMFKHPPPDQLMKMNRGGTKNFNLRAFGDSGSAHLSNRRELRASKKEDAEEEDDDKEEKDDNILDRFDEEEDEEKETAKDEKDDESVDKPAPEKREEVTVVEQKGTMKNKAAWDKFIADNHHTTIGIVLDRCDEPREQVGTVVLLPDPDNGGVKSRTFYNFTLDRDLDEGWTFNIEVKYNGQDLYDNWWDICEMEDDVEVQNRTFVCPVKCGPHSLVSDKHIPSYLPKGHYQSKAWVKDDKDKTLLCGFSDFVI